MVILLASLLSFNLQTTVQTDTSLDITKINQTLVDVIKTMAPEYKYLSGKDLKAKLSLGNKTSGKQGDLKALELNIVLGNLKGSWSEQYWSFELDTLLRLENTNSLEMDLHITAKTNFLAWLHWRVQLYEDENCGHLDSNSELSKKGCHFAQALKKSTTIDETQEVFEDLLDQTKKILAQQIADSQTDETNYQNLLTFTEQITIESLNTGGFALRVQGNAVDACISLDDTFLKDYPILSSLCFLEKTELSIKENTITLNAKKLQFFVGEVEQYEDIKESVSGILMGLETKNEESMDLITGVIYILLEMFDNDL